MGELERLLARRRKLVKKVADLDETIRTKKKFLRDLVQPDPVEVYMPLAIERQPRND